MNLIFSITPADYAGEIMCAEWELPVGRLFLASSAEGLCAVAFADGADEMRARLKRRLPRARFTEGISGDIGAAIGAIGSFGNCRSIGNCGSIGTLCLAPAAPTDFQLRVWRALLAVPRGATATYARIAADIGRPKALRAVGAAIGANPLAILVPCHRIVPSQGGIGRYHWGADRKIALLRAEATVSRRL